MSKAEPTEHDTLLDNLETLPGAVFLLDDSGAIVYANTSACALAGATREELHGTPFWRSAPQLMNPALSQAMLMIKETQEPTEVEYASSVTRTWLHVQLAPAVGGILLHVHQRRAPAQEIAPNNQPLSVAAPDSSPAGSDINTRKQAEDDLHTLIDAIPQFVWIMRPDGSCDYCNQRWYDYTGTTFRQAQGDGWLLAIHPDDQHPTLVLWQRALQTGLPYETELRVRHGATGAYRWFLSRAMPHKDQQGAIVRWIGTSTDIDEQKRAEQQLQISEQNWRVLAETVPQFVWTIHPDGQHEYANQRWYDYSRSTLEQLQSDQWSHLQFIHPNDQESSRAHWQHSLETGVMYEHEERLRNGQTGTYRWFLVRGLPVRDETGQIVKWFGTCTDIDEQKRIEEALRQSQAHIRALIDSSLIGIVSVEGEEEVLVEANEAFLHMTGYRREEIDSRTLTRAKITLPEGAPLFEHALQELVACGQHTPFETEIMRKDGSRLPIFIGGVLFQDHPRQIVTFVLDNSARKELEQRKDDFISMASHELRTPLTTLRLGTSLLHRQLAKQGIQGPVPALSRMETQIKTITRLVEELLDVSKIQAGRLEYLQETVDLDALLEEITTTMQQTYPSHRILVHGAVQASLIGDRDRLGQVFTNLLSNAIKYSPYAETVEMNLSCSPESITISVRDHGLGIPQEQQEKIFERFYRAADLKQRAIPGLGIGLYIVVEIVKRHGGIITVDSTVGKGSTFTVTLPKKRDG